MRKLLAMLLCALMILTCASALAEEDYTGITLHVVDINPDDKLYDEMIDAFIAAHPGIQVETTHAANGSGEVMASLISSGTLPNVFVTGAEQINVYTEYLYDWRDDTDVFEQFYDGYIESITSDDGSVYGLPNGSINVGLVYNKDVLAEAGYDSIPLTLDGFEQMCKDISEKTGAVPFICSAKNTWILTQMMDAYTVTRELPGKACAEKISSGEATVTTVSDHFDNYWRMMDVAKTYTEGESLLEYDWEYASNKLANGEVAIITYGDWCYKTVAQFNPDVKLGFSSYPVTNDEADAVTPTSTNQVALLFKDADNFELGKELAVFLTTSYESARYIVGGYGSVSCNKHSTEVDESLINDVLRQSSEIGSTTDRAVDRLQNYYPVDLNANYMAEAGEVVQGYLIGMYSVEEADAAIDELWPVAE